MNGRAPKDPPRGDQLWSAGLTASPHFRRWAELYPSVERRIGEILQRSNPQIASVAAVMLSRTRPSEAATPEDLRDRFSLTEAEASLAAALATGESLAGYAARRGVRLQTARNQLQSVFQKVGVNRQGALMRRLLAPK